MYTVSNRRYTGSKLKLAGWIIETIQKNCSGDSFFEIFAGTSIVSANIANSMKRIILNDTLESNTVIYNAFYANEKFSLKKIEKYKNKFQSIDNSKFTTGYFTKNYGGKYFGKTDAQKIETIRNFIEEDRVKLTKKEYSILLASLIYSMDKCANTVGHFDAYFKKKCVDKCFIFDIIEPMNFANTQIDIYSEDANALAPKVYADIVYIDPPYNSRQYCQFYHIYETLIKWDNPELFGIALKRKGAALSDYCRTKAPLVFADLIESLKCNYLVVSYNNTYTSKSNSSKNKIQLDEITNILSKYGKVKTVSKSHKAFNTGKTELPDHKEL